MFIHLQMEEGCCCCFFFPLLLNPHARRESGSRHSQLLSHITTRNTSSRLGCERLTINCWHYALSLQPSSVFQQPSRWAADLKCQEGALCWEPIWFHFLRKNHKVYKRSVEVSVFGTPSKHGVSVMTEKFLYLCTKQKQTKKTEPLLRKKYLFKFSYITILLMNWRYNLISPIGCSLNVT